MFMHAHGWARLLATFADYLQLNTFVKLKLLIWLNVINKIIMYFSLVCYWQVIIDILLFF